MRRRLLLAIALAALGAALAASAVSAAGDELLGSGEAGVSIDLPGLPPSGGPLPACSNLADDDGDGAVDLADPGCAGALDGDESDAPPGGNPPPQGEPEGGSGGKGGLDRIGPQGSGGPGSGRVGGGAGSGGIGALGEDGNGTGNGDGGIESPPIRRPDGTPTRANPALTVADFLPAPIGVPNFMIDQFSIPPFLLPIYQACGTRYGIPWQVLASINRIETAFGTNLNVSSAGAVGWMQFIPSSWKAYGVDANNDGRRDPYNPVDAICAAARYLRAAGGERDLRGAIFAYNHADWYVDEVLLYASQYGKLPPDLIGSLTGLTEGAHFPVAARSRYADDISEREALRRSKPGDEAVPGNVADVFSSSPTRRGINIYARGGAPVVAVNDGVIKKIGHDGRLGEYIVLQDDYGNRFTYAQLGRVSKMHPVPKQRDLSAEDFKLISPKRDEPPTQSATGGGEQPQAKRRARGTRQVERASLTRQIDALLGEGVPGYEVAKAYLGGVLEFDRDSMDLRPLREGSKVTAGTVLGHIGKTDELAPHVHFSIRPTGRGAPKIDPKPILDGWKLLEQTRIYDAAGLNPFAFASGASISDILLMSKTQLERRVLADPRLEIYACGREDIQTHQISSQVLALMEYLAERGFRLTVTSLKCGHSYYTTSGSVSHHSSGHAVDIAAVNGIPILGHQGQGSITHAVISELLKLQGRMVPAQIISLMEMGGPTFAMSDHNDHIHVGYAPSYSPGERGRQLVQLLKPDQWERLIERVGDIDLPAVRTEPSDYALPSGKRGKRASDAHAGE